MAETDYVTSLIVVSWILTGLVIVLTAARILGRTLFIKQTGWDDVFMLLGCSAAVVCSTLAVVGASHGFGRHLKDIEDPNDRIEAIKYTIIAPVLSIISSTSSKISILIFLVRLVGVSTKKWQLYFLWGLTAILVSFNIVAIVVIVRFCDPPEKQWKPWVPGTCLNLKAQQYIGFIQSGYNALMDIIVAIFPALFITRLRISSKMKVGLSVLMGGSVFGAAATIVKIYLLRDLDKHSDITWYWAPIALWYTAEMDVIIIVGNIPTLWPLLRLVRRKKSRSEYDMVTSAGSCKHGSEGLQLAGSATRILQEVDNMRTCGTWNDERGQLDQTLTTENSTRKDSH
ncbi:hypothetical protein F4802DRAFT_560164 [Xylaria palmicola]|nr:hypothetical protein F4802DRAFT_560164 [Xylaria palmicola]